MQTKLCPNCNKILSFDNFHKNKNTKLGIHTYCKSCRKLLENKPKTIKQKQYDKEYYLKNSNSLKEYQRNYRKNNRSKCRKWGNDWLLKNPHLAWAQRTIVGHKRRGFQVDISYKELEEKAKITKNCPLCDCELDWSILEKKYKRHNSPTLDRINNENIINNSNYWIICSKCNTIKHTMSLDELISYCKNIINKEKYLLNFKI